MSGQAKTTKSVFIPAPIDGLNLIANPAQLLPTEARKLHNYFIYDWGIRERAAATQVTASSTPDHMYTAYNIAGSKRLFLASSGLIERLDDSSDTTPTDITGTATFLNIPHHACQFNNRLFFFSLLGPPAVYNLITEADCADTGFTGPTLNKVVWGFSYKSRMYFIENDGSATTAKIWYGGVDAITGAMTGVDLSSILDDNAHLTYGFSFTYNQGNSNEELFCVGNNSGEILVYSGDYPAASNWTLVARLRIPELYPTTARGIAAAPLKFGSEVLIPTRQGIVAFSSVLGGSVPEQSYVQISRKLGKYLNYIWSMRLDPQDPFIYVTTYDTSIFPSKHGFFVLNYERGAWTSIGTVDGVGSAIGYEGYLYYSDASGLYKIPLQSGDGVDSSNADTKPVWKTPFFDFGSQLQKQSKHVRLIGKDLSSELQVRATVGVKTDFIDNDTPSSTDSRSVTVTSGVDAACELAPAAIGTRFSYVFQKTPAGEKNEITGFEAVIEEGGRY